MNDDKAKPKLSIREKLPANTVKIEDPRYEIFYPNISGYCDGIGYYRSYMYNGAFINTFDDEKNPVRYEIIYQDDTHKRIECMRLTLLYPRAKLGGIFTNLPYGIVKKSVPGIGATTLALNQPRDTIIVLPTKKLAYQKYLRGYNKDRTSNRFLYVGSDIPEENCKSPTDEQIRSYIAEKRTGTFSPRKTGRITEKKSLFTETAAIMEKKTILAACAAATLAFTGCSGGFSAAEEETIHAGKGEIMRILTVGNPADSLVLRQKAAPVTGRMLRTDDYAVLRRRMLATVQDPQNTGVGIAAPQVGILRRMIAVQRFDKPGEPFEFYLNPEIVESSAETAPGREGCLSIPGLAGRVVRAQRIVLRYCDERFAEKTETIDGFTAVIFQHETDHLDGILYTDRTDEAPTPEE